MAGFWESLLNPVSHAFNLPISAENMVRTGMGSPPPSLGPGIQAATPPMGTPVVTGPTMNDNIRNMAANRIRQSEPGVTLPMETPIPNRAVSQEQKDYEKKVREYMKNREAIIKNSEDRARILRQSQGFGGMDLSPLLALVDSETGSKLQQGYRRPLSNEERDVMARQYDQEAGQGYGALINNEVVMEQMRMQREKQREETALKNRLLGMGGYKANDIQRMRESLTKSDDAKSLKAMSDLRALLKEYRPLVAKHGVTMTGPERAAMDALKSRIDIAYKEAARLGALTGPDMKIIEQSLTPLTGAAGAMSNIRYMGDAKDAVLQQLDSADRVMEDSFGRLRNQIDATYPDVIKDAKDTLFKNFMESGGKKDTKAQSSQAFDPDAFLEG